MSCDALDVRDLHVSFPGDDAPVPAVRGVDLRIAPGRTLGLVGPSGSGKSALGLAVIGLLSARARVTGSVVVGGTELLGLDDLAMSRHRGRDVAMVFQDPHGSLTPVLRIGAQVDEAVRAHDGAPGAERRGGRRAVRARSLDLLRVVGMADPRRVADAYPHELSGGQRQRVAIAMAIANEPALVIADEPTTALDVTVQAHVLQVLARATQEAGSALLLITHDLGIVAGLADDVAVLDSGRLVEHETVDRLYRSPAHPTTVRLLAAAGGTTTADADVDPAAERADPVADPAADPGATTAEPVLDVRGLRVEYEERRTLAIPGRPSRSATRLGRRASATRVVEGVDLRVDAGECLALVGESGSGKTSTLLRIMDELTGVRTPGVTIEGTVTIRPGGAGGPDGTRNRSAPAGPPHRRSPHLSPHRSTPAQLVFQDASAALDPRMTVAQLIAEAVRAPAHTASSTVSRTNSRAPSRTDVAARVRTALTLVDLPESLLARFPWQLSGGQRQRVAIARALAADPAVLLLDEPVSALDVLVQREIVHLLAELRTRLGLSYLVVAHDLQVVRDLADRVAVMYAGRIVETGSVRSVFASPQHPYTRALLSAAPVPDPVAARAHRPIPLPEPEPEHQPHRRRDRQTHPERHPERTAAGCPVADRCPLIGALDPAAAARCRSTRPELVGHDLAPPDTAAACHHLEAARDRFEPA
ncbi:ATP-binding cassette domain-containing protein [Piscicoccus intestinalis]|uniref:ATP-binding cassette domain-containing protein n=1 Tax=Piscicoccus intestinalis TaxID=746033 RepID=UPI000838EB9E|nr:ABC transporter ATP-binding protein [Piscicoccus intestinalis]